MSMIKVKEKKLLNKYQIFFLRLSGNWPNDPNAIWFRLTWLLLASITLISESYYTYNHFSINKLPEFMENLGTAMCFLIGSIKIIIFSYKSQTFHRIINTITKDWNECASSNLPQISSIMNKNAILCDRCSKFILLWFTLSITAYSTSCFIFGSKDYQLIITMSFPFDVKSLSNYKIVLFLQYIYLLTFGIAWIGNIITLVLTLVFQIGGQLDMISHALENISINNEKPKSVGMKIRSLIGKHQKVILMAADIESLFTYILLAQFLSSTLIICCLGFVIAVTLSTNQEIGMLLKLASYYFPVTLEAFIYCYAGEYLINKSFAISYMVYEYEWYNLKVNDSRLLILLIMRSQKPLHLTIGKFVNLSLQQFTSIMKLSMSYISVLLAVY